MKKQNLLLECFYSYNPLRFLCYSIRTIIFGGNNMDVFADYLASIDNPDHRERTKEVLSWISNKFPKLEPHIKWNTPMFSDHGTYIIGFSIAKQHLSVSPEEVGMTHFANDIAQAGYSATKGLFRIPWNKPINYELLEEMIEFNIRDKANCSTFWRE